MIRQCAWCKKLMGSVPPLHDTAITHGICKECEKQLYEQIRKKKEAA